MKRDAGLAGRWPRQITTLLDNHLIRSHLRPEAAVGAVSGPVNGTGGVIFARMGKW